MLHRLCACVCAVLRHYQPTYLQAFEEPAEAPAGSSTRTASSGLGTIGSVGSHEVDEAAAAVDKATCLAKASVAVYVHLASALLEATDRDMALMWALTEYEVTGDSGDAPALATGEEACNSPTRATGAPLSPAAAPALAPTQAPVPVRQPPRAGASKLSRLPEEVVAPFRPVAVMVTAADVRAVLHQRLTPHVDREAAREAGATWSYALLFSGLQVVVCSPVTKAVAATAPRALYRQLPKWVVNEFRLWLTSTCIGAARCPEDVSASRWEDVDVLLHCVPSSANTSSQPGMSAQEDGELLPGDGKMLSVEVVTRNPSEKQPYKDVRVTVGEWEVACMHVRSCQRWLTRGGAVPRCYCVCCLCVPVYVDVIGEQTRVELRYARCSTLIGSAT